VFPELERFLTAVSPRENITPLSANCYSAALYCRSTERLNDRLLRDLVIVDLVTRLPIDHACLIASSSIFD
jgi:hypothetical protein